VRFAPFTPLLDLPAAISRRADSRLSAALVVAAVAAIPAAFYVAGLGFYLDDHYFLGIMSTSRDRSIPGLFDALARDDPKARLRPGMYAGLAILFRLFGTNPLPYHLFVAALVPVCAVLLYVILDRVRAPGFVAVGVPVVFAAAPHYSTDRFWLASYAAPASVALALAGVYSLLRASEAHGRRFACWLVAGEAAVVLSVLFYEVVVPLVIVVVIVFWYRRRIGSGLGSSRVAAVSTSLALAGVLVYKAIATTSLDGESSYKLGYGDSFAHHIGYLVSGSVKVNFGTYGLALPYVVFWIFTHRPTAAAGAASLLVGVVVLAYLARRGRDLELPAPSRHGRPLWRLLAAAGVALIVIGYASFLVTGAVYFTSAGIDNRVNIVAAIGVAVLAVGLVLRAIQLLPARRQALGFAVGVALLAATGTLITNTLADYWIAASTRQREVVADLRVALPPKLTGTTVVLDGVCPEIGPGVVFAASYDLAGTLRVLYHDPTIRAPVATAVVAAEERGLAISTVLFGRTGSPHLYPYRPRLLVYDRRKRSATLLRDGAAARRYLATTRRPSCPPLRSFNWGIHTSRLVPFA
jgi:hypothetical protein